MQKKRKQHLFYKNGQLSSVIGSTHPVMLFSAANTPLAECSAETSLTAVNLQNSITNSSLRDRTQSLTYSAYGHSHVGLTLGYTGQRYDRPTGFYLLGNGYRAFNPQIMRFLSPDSLSPFEKRTLNAYAYCMGDPINHVDPSGHMLKSLKNKFSRSPHLSHKKIDKARDKIIYNDVKSLADNSTPLESAKVVTAATPELNDYPNWYNQDWVTEADLQKAEKIHNLMKAITIDNNDKFLDTSGITEMQRMRLQNSTIELSNRIREAYKPSTPLSSRRSSLTSIHSTSTQYSDID